jgi:hypothetical protein
MVGCTVTPQPSPYDYGFRLSASVKMLTDAEPGVLLYERLGASAVWETPETQAGWAAVMAESEALIRAEAEPMFDRYGTPAGYLTFLDETREKLPVRHSLVAEQEYFARLILDDPTADGAGELAERALADDSVLRRSRPRPGSP